MKAYRMVGTHDEDLESGRVLAPGEIVDLRAEEERGERARLLISEGKLVEVPKVKDAKDNGGDD